MDFAAFHTGAGIVLGAVVSTTDAIAATSIAKRVGLPQRIVDVLEGESLVNDATGLLALEFSVAMLVTSRYPGGRGSAAVDLFDRGGNRDRAVGGTGGGVV